MKSLLWWFINTEYPRNVLYPFDVMLRGTWFGPLKSTISAFVSQKYYENRLWAKVGNVLFLGHFADTDPELGEPTAGVGGSSAGAFLGMLVLLSLFAAVWLWHSVARGLMVFIAALIVWFLLQLLIRWLLELGGENG